VKTNGTAGRAEAFRLVSTVITRLVSGTRRRAAFVFPESTNSHRSSRFTLSQVSAHASPGSNTGTYQGTVTLNQSNPMWQAYGSTTAYMFATPVFAAAQLQMNRSHTPLSNGSLTIAIPGVGINGGGSGGGSGTCFSPDTRIKTAEGDKTISELKAGDLVLTAAGTWRPVSSVSVTAVQSKLFVMPDGALVTANHRLLSGGRWIEAGECLEETKSYDGLVYNLKVSTEEPEGLADSPATEHSFTLSSGLIAHNGGPQGTC